MLRSFHVLTGCLYIFFGKILIPISCWILFVFLLLSCNCSLDYIMDTRPLSDVWFASIFFYSVECPFTLIVEWPLNIFHFDKVQLHMPNICSIAYGWHTHTYKKLGPLKSNYIWLKLRTNWPGEVGGDHERKGGRVVKEHV